MSKTILTLDEINLLKHSEEPKKEDLYGNLYKILYELKNPKAITLENLHLNSKGEAALTYNKKTLIDTVIKEWYAENVSESDPDKVTRCELCNTPNKYIYFIRNRLNNEVLNVGSHCITQFPGMAGYIEQHKQLSGIKNNHKIIARRNEFHGQIPDIDNILSELDEYKASIPIALSTKLQEDLDETIVRIRRIYTTYVDTGKKLYTTEYSVFELFKINYDHYNKLKLLIKEHIENNRSNPFVCNRREVEWLKMNNSKILKQIQDNNGIYKQDTIQAVCSADFIKDNINTILKQGKLLHSYIAKITEASIHITYDKQGYDDYLRMNILISDFMIRIGAKALFDKNFTFSDDDLISIAKMEDSIDNLQSIVNHLYKIMKKSGYALLIDYRKNMLILYRKNDKAIRNFKPYPFMNSYKDYMFFDEDKVKYFIKRMIGTTTSKWISLEEQIKYDTNFYVWTLYEEQWVDHM